MKGNNGNMELQVGKTYVDRQGAEVRIIRAQDSAEYPFVGVDADNDELEYGGDGRFYSFGERSDLDLVAEATPPPAEFPPRQADGTINPKDAAALTRVPLHLFPPAGTIYGAMACKDGADKYGPYNWRERSISLTQYVGAMQRHLLALLDGEDCASDSGLPHLAHVLATAAILLDAKQADALLDDRPKRPGKSAELIAECNALLKRRTEAGWQK